jgi:hypothetical protein
LARGLAASAPRALESVAAWAAWLVLVLAQRALAPPVARLAAERPVGVPRAVAALPAVARLAVVLVLAPGQPAQVPALVPR